ncbi:MAG: hypothetical protein ACLUMK_07475 [Christensenellales bacterium]
MEEKGQNRFPCPLPRSELARLLRSGGQTDEQLAAVLHDAHECDIAAALDCPDIRQRAAVSPARRRATGRRVRLCQRCG